MLNSILNEDLVMIPWEGLLITWFWDTVLKSLALVYLLFIGDASEFSGMSSETWWGSEDLGLLAISSSSSLVAI